MLVLSRKEGQKVYIGRNIVVTVNRIDGHVVSLGFDAPQNVRIVRAELPIADVSEHRPERFRSGE